MTTYLILWLMATMTPQDTHREMDHRGAMVMGFDQERTTHHFVLYQDGGAITITVNDIADVKNRDAIRSHLPHIATLFGTGRFDAPMIVHDSADVPGTRVLARRSDAVRYVYAETSGGGRIDIITTDREALAAVHEFLIFQITEHRTGDSTGVISRR